MTRRIEFTVEAIRRDADGLFVAGRCCEDEIHCGDHFEKLVEYEKPKTLAEYATPGRVLDERSIHVKVVLISAYGRNLETLDPGITAEIRLEGDAPGLRLGQVLAGVGKADPARRT